MTDMADMAKLQYEMERSTATTKGLKDLLKIYTRQNNVAKIAEVEERLVKELERQLVASSQPL